MKEITTPNIDLIRQSAVSEIQALFGEYKSNISKSLRFIGIADDGAVCFLNGYRDCLRKADDALHKINELYAKIRMLDKGVIQW